VLGSGHQRHHALRCRGVQHLVEHAGAHRLEWHSCPVGDGDQVGDGLVARRTDVVEHPLHRRSGLEQLEEHLGAFDDDDAAVTTRAATPQKASQLDDQ
jgi:hypothetical protein